MSGLLLTDTHTNPHTSVNKTKATDTQAYGEIIPCDDYINVKVTEDKEDEWHGMISIALIAPKEKLQTALQPHISVLIISTVSLAHCMPCCTITHTPTPNTLAQT